MRRQFLGFAFAMAVGAAAYAQSVPKPASASGGQNAGASVTVEGCIMKEVDVPARRPPENLRKPLSSPFPVRASRLPATHSRSQTAVPRTAVYLT